MQCESALIIMRKLLICIKLEEFFLKNFLLKKSSSSNLVYFFVVNFSTSFLRQCRTVLHYIITPFDELVELDGKST